MDHIEKHRNNVLKAVSARGLTSLMNQTKWEKLIVSMTEALPFPPAYQRKDVLSDRPEPGSFEEDVWYHGDWKDAIHPCVSIEWLRIRPRYVKPRGALVPPGVVDEEEAFVEILHRHRIPYRHGGDSFWIYGYASDTTGIRIGK